jgi:Leucine-rich repeat (LRR) protein
LAAFSPEAARGGKQTRPGLWEIVQKYTAQKTAAATPALKQRVVHFPADRSIGKLMIQDENARRHIKSFHYWTEAGDSEWEYLGEAQGDVSVPAGVRLALTVGTGAWKDLSGLFALNPDDLHMLSIYGPPAGGPSPGGPLPGDGCMPCIAHLTGLKILYLGNMNVTKRGLQSLRALKTLERLTLPKQVTDQTLAEIAGLSTLKALYLDESRLTDEGLVQIEKLTNLEELSLGQGRMTNAALTHLAKLPRLRYLMLQGKGWTDAGMAYLKNIPSLRILHLGHLTQLTDAALAHLCEIPNLENLSLHWNQNITDKGIAHLGQLKGLKRLHIGSLSSGNPFSDKSLQVIGSLQLLEELAISGQAISDSGMDHIARLTNLKALSLFCCPNVTEAGLAKIASLKSLEKLLVSQANVTVAGLARLGGLTNLKKLSVGDLNGGGGVLDISGLTGLEEVRLSFGAKSGEFFADEDLKCLANLKRIEWLQIGPRKFTDAGMVHLANLTNMERLNIGGPELTDDGLRHLAGMRSLNHLTIDDGNITDAGLGHIAGFKALSYLNITTRGRITAAGKRLLREKLPDMGFFETRSWTDSRRPPGPAG